MTDAQQHPTTDTELTEAFASMSDEDRAAVLKLVTLLEQQNADKDKPTKRADGRMEGHGWQVYPTLMVDTNVLPDIEALPDVVEGQIYSATKHWRDAFAVVGALVADGAIQVNFHDKNWHIRFELMVWTASRALALLD